MGNRPLLLSSLSSRWYLGADQRYPPGSGPARRGTRSRADRRDHRQPVGEDHGKRGPRGYDAGKKVTGRKRHIVVDTMGMLLAVVVHAANIQDRDGATLVLRRLQLHVAQITLIWADGAYGGAV